MTSTPQHSDGAIASASVCATLFVVEASLASVQRKLGALGAVVSSEARQLWPRESCPLLIEFWTVSEGRMSPLGIDATNWIHLASTAWGSAASLALPSLAAVAPVADRVARFSRAALAAGDAWASRAFGSYHEVLCAIPEVFVAGLNEPALFVAEMFADSPFARIVDKALDYGFGKKAARIGVSPSETHVVSTSGRLVASFRHASSGNRDSDEHTRLEPHLRRWLKQPLLGRAADGGFVTLTFSRDGVTELESVNVELRVGEPLAALIGFGPRHDLETMQRAVGFRQRWRVGLTAPRRIAPAPREDVRE